MRTSVAGEVGDGVKRRARGVIARNPTVHSTPTTVTASIPPRHEDASATGRARSRPESPPRVVPAM